jgi:hypothetical protein
MPLRIALIACVCSFLTSDAALIRSSFPGDSLLPQRPDHTKHSELARWLVHVSTWGTVSTTHLDQAYGNSLSLSDGPLGNSTGRLLFYLTPMDVTMQDLEINPVATLSLCEAQLSEGCQYVDPQEPTCAKLAISGTFEPVPAPRATEAEEMVFARHPDMRSWPAGHRFQVWELLPRTLSLLDWYGGPHEISPEDYFAATVGDLYAIDAVM